MFYGCDLIYFSLQKLNQTALFLCPLLFSSLIPSPMYHFFLLSCPPLSPALPVVHSSGWEWTSQLAPLKETHISGCSPFPSVIFPSIETWPLSVHWLNISLSLSLFIPALLCCHCYHAAVQFRKGLSGYSSHYWLLNLVMVVKALPVPLCRRGQLMACFMSLQCRASLLGHCFIHSPSPSMLHPRGRKNR